MSPDILDFGTLPIGDTLTLPITLTSVEGGEIRVVAATFLDAGAGWFAVGALPVIPAGGAAELEVTYAPGEAGWHSTSLTVVTDEPQDNAHVIALRGSAGAVVGRVRPLMIDFGPVAVGDEAAQRVEVVSEGAAPLMVASAVTGAPFSASAALPMEVAPGEVGQIDVSAAPSVAEMEAGELLVDLGAAGQASVRLQVNACGEGDAALYDGDGDGWVGCAGDCDDGDPAIWPGGEEVCDGADQDCDGVVDEGTGCADDDGDGYSEDGGDCDDSDAAISPGGSEIAGNGVDDDCDGGVDGAAVDLDGDGWTAVGGDCDEGSGGTHPGAPETADGADNDCDGVVDEGTTAFDDDGDGYTEAAGDCDDGDATIRPGAAEAADGADNDCDGAVDEGTVNADDDGDGFTEVGGDCNDGDGAISPGAQEVAGDRVDNDCDGAVE